jgi:hypothetical protein
MPEYLLQYKLEIKDRQVIKLPAGAKVIDIIISDDRPRKPHENPDLYLVVKADQEVVNGMRKVKDDESRVFVTYSLPSMIPSTRKNIVLVGRYSISFATNRTKVFYVFEQLK